MRIAVTGGSGKAGRVIVRDLLEHGHEVLNIDRTPLLVADLTDLGETIELSSARTRSPRTPCSQLLGEEMGREFSRWTGIPFIGLPAAPVLLGRSAPPQVEPLESPGTPEGDSATTTFRRLQARGLGTRSGPSLDRTPLLH